MRLKNEMCVQNKHLISDMIWILLVLFIDSNKIAVCRRSKLAGMKCNDAATTGKVWTGSPAIQ